MEASNGGGWRQERRNTTRGRKSPENCTKNVPAPGGPIRIMRTLSEEAASPPDCRCSRRFTRSSRLVTTSCSRLNSLSMTPMFVYQKLLTSERERIRRLFRVLDDVDFFWSLFFFCAGPPQLGRYKNASDERNWKEGGEKKEKGHKKKKGELRKVKRW